MCPAVPAKCRKELDKLQECHAYATVITPEDVRLSETGRGELPKGIYGLLQQLGRYSAILKILTGDTSHHKLQMDSILESLSKNLDQFEELSPRQTLYLIWDIHQDAKRFFSKFAPIKSGGHSLPKLNLAMVTHQNGAEWHNPDEYGGRP